MTEAPAHIFLPPPISMNKIFNNVPGRGRVLTEKYAAWRSQAAVMLMAQKPLPRFTHPVFISLMVGEKGVGNMDADNAAKAYIDALKRGGVIVDDSKRWVRSSRSTWVPGFRGCVAIIGPAQEPPLIESLRRFIPSNLWNGMQ